MGLVLEDFSISLLANAAFAPIAELINVGTEATTGQSAGPLVKQFRNQTVSRLRQQFKAKPPSARTNHDLQRAIFLSYHKAGTEWLSVVEALAAYATDNPQFDLGDHTPDSLRSFSNHARKHLCQTERLAYHPEKDFQSVLDDANMSQLIVAVPEATSDEQDYADICRSLTVNFVDWLQAAEKVGDIPEPALNQLNVLTFGRRVLMEIVEILKSGTYPEATKAFEFQTMGEIRQDIKALQTALTQQFKAQGQVLQDLSDKTDQALYMLNGLTKKSAEIVGKLDEIKDIVSENNDLLRIQAGIILDRKRQMEGGEDNFVEMRFDQRRTRYMGREIELNDLHHFVEKQPEPQQGDFFWWQIAGPGGQGKSRLALELINALGPQWHAGFLSADELQKTDFDRVQFFKPTLIVVDYAAAPAKAAKVAQAITRLAKRADGSLDMPLAHPVRFLVLERGAFSFDMQSGPGLNWLRGALEQSEQRQYLEHYAYRPQPLILGWLDDEALLSVARS